MFASLALADAMRKRYPLSAEAAGALQRAQRLLAETDVGAAREELSRYIGDSLA